MEAALRARTREDLAALAIWALSGGGSFWPAWAMLGWGIALGMHGVRPLFPGDEEEHDNPRGPTPSDS